MNDGGDGLRDRDLIDEIVLKEDCLLNGGDSDRDLIEGKKAKNFCNENERRSYL